MANNLLSNISSYPNPAVVDYDSGDLEKFIDDLFDKSAADFATFSFPLDVIDPLAYLEMCWKSSSFQYYWEKPSDEFAIAAGDSLLNITASGPNRFESIYKQFDQIKRSTAEFTTISHSCSGMLFLGGFSFNDKIEDNRWASFAPASLTVPEWMIIKDGKFALATFAVKVKDFDTANSLHQYLQKQLQKIENALSLNPEKSDRSSPKISWDTPPAQNGAGYNKWISSVNKAKRLIRQESFDKIVLARDIAIAKNTDVTPTQVLNKLRQQYTNCYNFLIHNSSGKTFLGSTPERLGAFRNQLLLTDALAGSIQRGETATEDAIFEKNLSNSQKNQDEHNFVIKDIEERLQPFVKQIDRDIQPEIKKLSNVQHLYTPIRAQLKDDTNMLEVIGQLHPTPAVGGYPWNEAAPYIDELEDFDRGWYAGPVGWFNTSGGGEFAVAIRSGLFTEDKAHFFAGCGIVEDSDPAAEWKETNLKLKPMLSALQYD